MVPPAVLSYVIRGGGATCASVCATGGTAARPGYGLLGRGQLLAQLVALNLAGRCLGQLGHEDDPARILHRRERRLDVLLQRFGQLVAGLLAVLEHDKRLWLDEPLVVAAADHPPPQ